MLSTTNYPNTNPRKMGLPFGRYEVHPTSATRVLLSRPKQTGPDIINNPATSRSRIDCWMQGPPQEFLLINIRTAANSIPNKLNPMALQLESTD